MTNQASRPSIVKPNAAARKIVTNPPVGAEFPNKNGTNINDFILISPKKELLNVFYLHFRHSLYYAYFC